MEKLKKIIKQIQDIFSKIFYPILGSVCLSKEKRFSIEFDEKSIKICKISPNGKKILKIVEEKFDFDEKMNFAENQIQFSEEIKQILAREKLIGHEATVIIPTSKVKISSLKIPTISPLELEEQSKKEDFWAQHEDANINFEEDVINYQIVGSDKVSGENNILVAATNKKEIENIYNILINAGVNPNVFEPKCFGNINGILNSRKIYKTSSFALFEYGEKENYFFIHTPKEVLFIQNTIIREDLVLIKQIERLPDPTGPFWNEVYERILTDVNTKLEDTGGITKDGIEGFDLKDVFVHTELGSSENFVKGLKNKLPDLNFKLISFLPQPASSEVESENIFDNELMKFDKKLEKQFMEYEPESQDYYPNVGAALRFFNPFSSKEPNQIKYKLNLHHMYENISNNRRVRFTNSSLNLILILLILTFASLTSQTYPVYLEKANVLINYDKVKKDHDNLIKQIGSATAKTKRLEEKRLLANKIIKNKDEFTQLIIETPSIVPSGIEISKLQYVEDDHAVFNGYALSDEDLNIFLSNLRINIGKPELRTIGITKIKKEQSNLPNTNAASNVPTPPTVNADPENIQGDLTPLFSNNNAPTPDENLDDGTLMEVKNFVIRVDLKKDKLQSKNG